MPRTRSSERNRSSVNHRRSSCEPKWSSSRSIFRCTAESSRWTNRFGRTEIAVVLGNLVLEDQVVAPRVPRQLASQPVVLVQVVALMSEDQVRRELRLEAVEELLDRAALVRKERIAEIPDDDPRRAEAGREVGSAPPSLLRTLAVAGQDDPQDLGLGIGLRQPQDAWRRSRSRCRLGGRRSRARADCPRSRPRSDAVRASGRATAPDRRRRYRRCAPSAPTAPARSRAARPGAASP